MPSFRRKVEVWDAKYNFPRPANEQHLSGYQAFFRLSTVAGLTAAYAAFGLFSLGLSAAIFANLQYLDLPFDSTWGSFIYLIFFLSIIFIAIAFLADTTTAFAPFMSFSQRETYGNERWATEADLNDRQMLFPSDKPLPGDMVRLVPFRFKQIALNIKQMAMGGTVIAPAGSGKSSLIFMWLARSFSRVGGMVALDIKGELYEYTMKYFARVYRIDIRDPRFSDHLDLFGGCYKNPNEAYSLATYILGYNPNKTSSGNPIWDQSAVSMLGLLLLHIAQMRRNPTPNDILRFLSTHPPSERVIKVENGEEVWVNPLHEAMSNSRDEFVRMMWVNQFKSLPHETFNSVKFNIDGRMKDFFNPKLEAILRPPTEKEKRRGRKTISFAKLREMTETPNGMRGTALYVVVSVKDTKIMESFIRTFFSFAVDNLRQTDNTETPVLFALDEAGNVPLYTVPEGINTDRAIGLCYWLGYQDIAQPASQFGDKTAETFMAALNTYIFLPGIKGKTAAFAANLLGKTTILHKSSSDSKNNNFDADKVSEASTNLMYETALRQMPTFRKCVVVTGDCPPIFTAPNPDAKEVDSRRWSLKHMLLEPAKITDDLRRAIGLIKTKHTLEDEMEDDLKRADNTGDGYIPPPDELEMEINQRDPTVVDSSEENKPPTEPKPVKTNESALKANEKEDSSPADETKEKSEEKKNEDGILEAGLSIAQKPAAGSAASEDQDDLEID